MKTNWILITSITLLLVILTGACGKGQPTGETTIMAEPGLTVSATPAPEVAQPTAESEESVPEITARRYTFDQLGISLEIPAELGVTIDLHVDYEDASKLDAYLFYIQYSNSPGGAGSGNFQMYGFLQFVGIPPISWEEFSSNTINSSMNAYANEININGVRGYDTQLSGERNRFVYLFYLDGHILSIAVSDPTEENKALADQILSTLEFNPEKLTDASQVQLIQEPSGYYRIYIPADWKFSFNNTAGAKLSDLEASSPDAKLLAGETDGSNSMLSYQSGVFLNLSVLDDDSALAEPAPAAIHSATTIMLAGIEGTSYVFAEPSIGAGEIREVRFYTEGKSFLLRFGYAPDVDQVMLDWIIRSFEIAS